MMDGSFASSPMTWSAGGQDEHPCEVNSSTTARGSADAGRIIAMMAHTETAPDHRKNPPNSIMSRHAGLAAIDDAATKNKPSNAQKAALHRPPSDHLPLTSQ
jgi:hypothetical protein